MTKIDNTTLKGVVDQYLENGVFGTVQPKTYQSYQVVCKCLWRYLDPRMDITVLNRTVLQIALINMANDGLSRSTIVKAEQLVRRAVKEQDMQLYLSLEGCPIPRNAMERVVDALTREEQALVEMACMSVTYGDLYLFLLDTGLRGMELCRLRWEDYDGEGILITQSKTANSNRYVPLTRRANAIILKQPRRAGVIFQTGNRTPITETVLKRTYLKIRELTGIERFSVRICRHTFATRLVEKGVNIKTVSKLMGHSSVSFTLQRYTTISKEMLRRGIEVLN